MKFKESKSIYLQIADRIMDEILRMVYPEEGRVPSVREYAAMVEVNANTVVRSYDYLQGQEIIYNNWLVVEPSPDLLFKTKDEEKWQRAVDELGFDVNRVSLHTGRA